MTHPQSYLWRAHRVPSCPHAFNGVRGGGSRASPPRLFPHIYLTGQMATIYLSNIYWALITTQGFARDLETQSWKHMVFVL